MKKFDLEHLYKLATLSKSFDEFKNLIGNQELVIELEDWDYRCGDGCCYEWGVDCTINGEKIVGGDYSNLGEIEQGIKIILEYLGINHEIKYK